MLSFENNQMSNVFVDMNVRVKNHNFKFHLILDKYNIMKVMQNYFKIYAGIYFCYQCNVST